VDVGHPLGGPFEQLGRLHAADDEMPGIQAQQDGAGVHQPQYRVPVLDRRPYMGMQRAGEPQIGGDLLQPRQVGQEHRPFRVGHHDLAVVAPVRGLGRQDDGLGPTVSERLHRRLRRVEVQVRTDVHRHRQNPPTSRRPCERSWSRTARDETPR
jgi:hypothetical protein